MNGIKTSTLECVKTQILADTNLRNDFSHCVMLYMEYLVQTNENKSQDVNISVITTAETEKGDRMRKSIKD